MALQERGERLLAGAARRLLGDRRLLIATNRGPVSFAIRPTFSMSLMTLKKSSSTSTAGSAS